MSMPYRRSRSFRAAPRMLVVMALLTSLTAGPVGLSAAAAEEDTTVTFTGAGWGHGVGLSQYGAYGMAKEGATASEILEHFFVGSSVQTMGEGGLDVPDPLWVNLEMDRTDLELVARDISYVDPPGPTAAMIVGRGDDEWELTKDDRLLIHWDSSAGTCDLTIEAAAGGSPNELGAGPCLVDITWDGDEPQPTRKVEIAGCSLTDYTAGTTLPCQYGRGMLHLRVGPGGMDLSVELGFDEYVLGIEEMPYYWGDASHGGFEALKAQAIAARSYARELQLARGPVGNNSCGAWCDVRDSTFDQRYVGWGHGRDEWTAAVEETQGQVVTHADAPNGTIVRTYYSSSSGGATENIDEVWSSPPFEYYSSVDDHWSLDPSLNGNASWTKTVAAATVAAKVGLDDLISIHVTARNTSGSASVIEFTGISGGEVVTVAKASSWVKSTFGLKSIYFDVGLEEPPPPFVDIVDSVHYDAIAAIWDRGITYGCNPPANDRYCPAGSVTRGEMAAFLVRALDLPATDHDAFVDDGDSIFQDDINRLAAAGITRGCNPPDNDRYCPDQPVTREQMAAFLVRAFTYTDGGEGDRFVDDDESIFEADIDRLATAAVTYGCNPPDNDRFCPTDPVRRDQMASFLDRALTGAGA
jgi:stage II sporulation protein D